MVKVELCHAPDAAGEASAMKRALAARSIEAVAEESGGVSAAVLLLSPLSCSSVEFFSSVERAVAANLLVYPVFLCEMELPERLDFLVSSHQWLDASSGDIEAAAERIAGNLLMREDPSTRVSASSAASTARCSATFVGRTKELAFMSSVLDSVKSSPGPVVLGIRGEAGVGKTSLAGRFLGSLCNDADCFNEVSADSDDSSVDYILWARLVILLVGGGGEADDLEALLCSRLGCTPESPAVSEAGFLLPLPFAAPAPSEREKLGERVAVSIAKLVSLSHGEGRKILFIDNIHWADAGSLAMLEDVLRELGSLPLFVLLAYRPEMPGGTPVSVSVPDNCTAAGEVFLEPLSLKESTELLGLLMQGEPSSSDEVMSIARTAQGWPLHIELLARSRLASPEFGLFDMRQLINQSFQRLPGGRRKVLEALAVMGGEALVSSVMEVAGLSAGSDILLQNDDFAVLERTSLSGGLHYRQDILREAVYNAVEPLKKQNYHLRTAFVLERKHRGDPRFAGEICSHWENGGMLEKAIESASVYLKHICMIFHSSAVVRWAEKAEQLIMKLGLTPERAEQLAVFFEMSEEALSRIGLQDRQEEILDKLEELSLRYELRERLSVAYCARAMIRKDQGRYEEAVELLQKALECESEKHSYRAACAMANMAIVISDHRDRLPEAEELYLTALKVFRETGERRDEGSTNMHLGILSLDKGDAVKALEYYEAAGDAFRSINFAYGEALVLTNVSSVYLKLDRPEEAISALRTAADMYTKVGDTYNLAIVLGNMANIVNGTGRLLEADEEYRKAIELNVQTGNRRSEEIARSNHSDCLRKMGSYSEALQELDLAMEINGETKNTFWKMRILDGRGRALFGQGLLQPARESLELSLEIAIEKGYSVKNRILVGLGVIEILAGEPEKALDYCTSALKDREDPFSATAVEAMILQSDALTALGRPEEALESARQAQKEVEHSSSVFSKCAAAACEGRVLAACGRIEESSVLLARAGKMADECRFGNLYWLRGTEKFKKKGQPDFPAEPLKAPPAL